MGLYKSNKKTKNVLYPIFLECSELCTDDSWKQLYIDFSNGKCQRNIYIANNCINSSSKNKALYFSYSFSNKKAEDIVVELHEIYSKFTSFCSVKDLKKKKSDMEVLKKKDQEFIYPTWKSIKKKQIKIQLIEAYAIRMKKKYSLTTAKTISLVTLITNGLFIFNSQCSDDVIYDNGEIKSIKGIVYENGDFVNKFNIKATKEVEEKIADNCLYYSWPKIVASYYSQAQVK